MHIASAGEKPHAGPGTWDRKEAAVFGETNRQRQRLVTRIRE